MIEFYLSTEGNLMATIQYFTSALLVRGSSDSTISTDSAHNSRSPLDAQSSWRESATKSLRGSIRLASGFLSTTLGDRIRNSAQYVLRASADFFRVITSSFYTRSYSGSPRSRSSSLSSTDSDSSFVSIDLDSSRSSSPSPRSRSASSQLLRSQGLSYGTQGSEDQVTDVNERLFNQIQNNSLVSRVQAVWTKYKTQVSRKYTELKEKINSNLAALKAKVVQVWDLCKKYLIAWKAKTCLGRTLYKIGLGLAEVTCCAIGHIKRLFLVPLTLNRHDS
jgi:hypothetical protein